jgi:hypothetical protein
MFPIVQQCSTVVKPRTQLHCARAENSHERVEFGLEEMTMRAALTGGSPDRFHGRMSWTDSHPFSLIPEPYRRSLARYGHSKAAATNASDALALLWLALVQGKTGVRDKVREQIEPLETLLPKSELELIRDTLAAEIDALKNAVDSPETFARASVASVGGSNQTAIIHQKWKHAACLPFEHDRRAATFVYAEFAANACANVRAGLEGFFF